MLSKSLKIYFIIVLIFSFISINCSTNRFISKNEICNYYKYLDQLISIYCYLPNNDSSNNPNNQKIYGYLKEIEREILKDPNVRLFKKYFYLD